MADGVPELLEIFNGSVALDDLPGGPDLLKVYLMVRAFIRQHARQYSPDDDAARSGPLKSGFDNSLGNLTTSGAPKSS
jgi:hypothetical protein